MTRFYLIALLLASVVSGNAAISLNRAPKASGGTLISESFENLEIHSAQLPQGWTRKNTMASGEAIDHWFATTQLSQCVEPQDGEMYMAVMFNSEYKDEWLISPEFTVTDNRVELNYYWWTGCVAWFYKFGPEYVDYEQGVFIKREVACTLEVLVKEGDGEWTKIHDVLARFEDIEYRELYNKIFPSMLKETVSLGAYSGKTIQLAFRYVGTDGESVMLDNVSVGYPRMTPSYEAPLCRQYYGYSLDGEFNYIAMGMEFYPVYQELTWYNTTPDEAAYTWTYTDPDTHEEATSDNPDELTLVFRPDCASEATIRNNVYATPKLTASAPGFSEGTFESAAKYLQAGGIAQYYRKAEQEGGEDEEIRFGVLPFDLNTEGFDIYVKDAFDFGRNDIPIFGYSEDSDEWWNNYTFPSGVKEDEFAYVTGYMNRVVPSAPMVVKGVAAAAVGRIGDEALFRLEIRALDENSEPIEEPIAVAKTTGAEVVKQTRGVMTDYLTLIFKFDKPVVLSGAESPYGYLVEVSGYHDAANVEYFAPMQSMKPNEYGYAFGLYRHHRKFAGVEDDNISYPGYFKNAEGQDLDVAFAIALDACYPWLVSEIGEDEVVEVGDQAAVVDYNSYYDTSDLEINAPEWLNVIVKGRYDKARASFSIAKAASEDREGVVTFSAPGVSRSFKVKAIGGADAAIVGADAMPGCLYNSQGMLLKRSATTDDLSALPAGIYILDGRKVVK